MPGDARIPRDPPFPVDVDGDTGVCARPDAAWWLPLLASGDWLTIATTAVPRLIDRLWDPADVFDLDDAARFGLDLTQTATGMPWPRAVRLAAQAVGAWPQFEAWAITHAHGLDPLTCPVRRTLAAVHAMLLATCEKDSDAERLAVQLDNPIGVPGYVRAQRQAQFTVDPSELAELTGPMTFGKAR